MNIANRQRVPNAQGGFSILSAVIAMGIAGIVTSALASTFKQASMLQRNSEQLAERQAFLAEVRGVLAFSDVCTKNFGGLNVSVSTNTWNLSNIVSVTDQALYAVGSKYYNGLVRLESAVLKDPTPISSTAGRLTLTLVLAKTGQSVGALSKAFDTTILYSKAAAGTTIVSCGTTAMPTSPVLSSGDLVNNLDTIDDTFTTTEAGIVTLSVSGEINCDPASDTAVGASVTAKIDGATCGRQKDGAYVNSSKFYMSLTCIKTLAPGTHTLEGVLDVAHCGTQSLRQMKLQFVALRGI